MNDLALFHNQYAAAFYSDIVPKLKAAGIHWSAIVPHPPGRSARLEVHHKNLKDPLPVRALSMLVYKCEGPPQLLMLPFPDDKIVLLGAAGALQQVWSRTAAPAIMITPIRNPSPVRIAFDAYAYLREAKREQSSAAASALALVP